MIGYRIKLAPDDNGKVLVTCPGLPEVTTFGEDEADALRRAVDAIEEALAARMADGDDHGPCHTRISFALNVRLTLGNFHSGRYSPYDAKLGTRAAERGSGPPVGPSGAGDFSGSDGHRGTGALRVGRARWG